MDRVIAYKFVLARIPGRANAAADFLSRMQTDPGQNLELQLFDPIPMRRIDNEMKPKTPNASMLSIERPETQQKEPIQPAIPRDLLDQLHTNDTLQSLIPKLNEILESALPKETIELYCLIRTHELNSIQYQDPLNYFKLKNSNTGVMDNQTEQRKDPALRKIIFCIQNGCNDDNTYASFELKTHHQNLSRLQLQKGNVMRQIS